MMIPAPSDPPFDCYAETTVLPAQSGGLSPAGSQRAEPASCDATVEEIYWRTHHRTPAALADQRTYEDYAAAYRTGYTGYRKGQTFAERAADLAREYGVATEGAAAGALVIAAAGESVARKQRLAWEEVRGPIQAAYERIAQSESARMVEETARPGSGHLLP